MEIIMSPKIVEGSQQLKVGSCVSTSLGTGFVVKTWGYDTEHTALNFEGGASIKLDGGGHIDLIQSEFRVIE
jgi:hypothetical protein